MLEDVADQQHQVNSQEQLGQPQQTPAIGQAQLAQLASAADADELILRCARYALLDRLEAEALPVVNRVPGRRWNSDKAYLADLADKGVAVVPTIDVTALDAAALADARGQDHIGRKDDIETDD